MIDRNALQVEFDRLTKWLADRFDQQDLRYVAVRVVRDHVQDILSGRRFDKTLTLKAVDHAIAAFSQSVAAD